jgi:hypothetical protein
VWITLGRLDERLHTLAVGQNRDERLEVFGTAADDTIWHTWQTAANGAWRGSFAPLGRPDERLRTLAVGQNADGRLEVFGVAADDTIWHIWQLSTGGAWHDGFVNLASRTSACGRSSSGATNGNRLDIEVVDAFRSRAAAMGEEAQAIEAACSWRWPPTRRPPGR